MRNWFLVLIILPSIAWATNKPLLRIVAPEIPQLINTDGTGTYWNIIKAIYQPHYKLQLSTALPSEIARLKQEEFADAFISFGKNTNSVNDVFSKQHIDTRYSIHLLYNPAQFEYTTPSSLEHKVVATTREFTTLDILPYNTQMYQVDSIANINKLVHNKRIDALVTYSYNVHLSDPEQSLTSVEIAPAQKVYLQFPSTNGQRLADEFDAAMAKLLADKEIEQYFEKEADYLHANFFNTSQNNQIDWHLVPKKYSQDSKKLEALEQEIHFSSYIDRQLSNIDLDIQVNSSRIIFEHFKTQDNQCALNISKTEERQLIAYFSLPSYVFLAPRLLTISGSKIEQELSNQSVNTISLEHLLIPAPQYRIAIIDGGNTEKVLLKSYSQDLLDNLVQISDVPQNKILPLLLNKRVDAVIVWPSLIPNIIADSKVSNQLTTFGLNKLVSNYQYSYIACSKSEKGLAMIEAINLLLEQKKHRSALFDETLSTMDNQSVVQFKELLVKPL
ncbi:transporter substrate-binding domain-containing protein [Thalassotalea sp. M1531]|uniref:Transporter substrate-binding domain-containing protein n=1 Tax=Thalassotalea algicola TaxID=2716224 RepID=A0A7Y0Q5I7_9GAMM|nr:transporter substrate-binding domain-containing protein [Thalassotalea algicola]NMP30363.1 transporter substrate-binding domain-containing protein [Thalassotalea algicola]